MFKLVARILKSFALSKMFKRST